MTWSYDYFNSLRYLKEKLGFHDVIKARFGINIVNMVEIFAIVDSSNVGWNIDALFVPQAKFWEWFSDSKWYLRPEVSLLSEALNHILDQNVDTLWLERWNVSSFAFVIKSKEPLDRVERSSHHVRASIISSYVVNVEPGEGPEFLSSSRDFI